MAEDFYGGGFFCSWYPPITFSANPIRIFLSAYDGLGSSFWFLNAADPKDYDYTATYIFDSSFYNKKISFRGRQGVVYDGVLPVESLGGESCNPYFTVSATQNAVIIQRTKYTFTIRVCRYWAQ